MGIAVRKGRWRRRSSEVRSAENMVDVFRCVCIVESMVEVYRLEFDGCAGFRA
jgi:hypothetical protein